MLEKMTVKLHHKEVELDVVNPDDKDFWPHLYAVGLDSHFMPWLVFASSAQDALDELGDYLESIGATGYFLDDGDRDELEQYGEVAYIGNHGLPVDSSDIFLKKIK